MQEEGPALGDTCHPQHRSHLALGFNPISLNQIPGDSATEVKNTHPVLGSLWCSAGKTRIKF